MAQPPICYETLFVPTELSAAAEQYLPAAEQMLAAIKSKNCTGSEWTGWFDYPKTHGQKDLQEIENWLRNQDTYFDLVVVVGIGGSYAGSKAVADALSHGYLNVLPRSTRLPIVFAGHNLAESSLLDLIDLLDRRQPVINVISKSGTTTEPGVAFRILRDYLERRFGEKEASRRIVVTTDSKRGALRSLADEKKYRSFSIPDDIGGRFSVLTPVGMLPLAMAGFDANAILDGADKVFSGLRSGVDSEISQSVLHYASLRRALWQQGKKIEVLTVSDPKLMAFVEWWKQLFGESEGKSGRGLFPAGFLSTTDLHSMGQYLQDGERTLAETFVVFDDPIVATTIERRLVVPSQAGNADGLGYLAGRRVEELNFAVTQAAQLAHGDGGVPVTQIRLARLDEYHVGALFAFCETACALSALLLDVNPFDQPGVESYKQNLFALLGKPGFEKEGAELRSKLGK